MAKLKMLKLPKQPKLPKKPKRNASLAVKENFLRRVAEVKAKHSAKLKAVHAENAKRHKENQHSERLDTVISGINSVKVFSSSFSARSFHKRRKKAGTKHRKASHKKTTHRRKRR
jgi:hypothetical protein